MSEGWEFMPWYGMIFGPIVMILVLASVVMVVVMLIRWLDSGFSSGGGHRYSPPRSQSAALHILEERFAKGEIDKQEFEEKKRILLDH